MTSAPRTKRDKQQQTQGKSEKGRQPAESARGTGTGTRWRLSLCFWRTERHLLEFKLSSRMAFPQPSHPQAWLQIKSRDTYLGMEGECSWQGGRGCSLKDQKKPWVFPIISLGPGFLILPLGKHWFLSSFLFSTQKEKREREEEGENSTEKFS